MEEGFDYVCDWVLDDEPVVLKTRGKPIVNIPYTQECNDVAMMLIQHHKASEYHERAVDQFDQIYADSERSARVMALVVHPYIMGAPHRLKHFARVFEHIRRFDDVAFMTGEQNPRLVSCGAPRIAEMRPVAPVEIDPKRLDCGSGELRLPAYCRVRNQIAPFEGSPAR